MAGTEWTLPDGTPLKYQDGDYVRIDVEPGSPSALRLPFLGGYVRGYSAVIGDGGPAKVAYALFKVGHNLLNGVREEKLLPAHPQFGDGHGRAAHQGGEVCHLCGANT
jgi:hypothetical protein